MKRLQKAGKFVSPEKRSAKTLTDAKVPRCSQSNILIEGLESRRLLSGYGFSTLTSFTDATTGSAPSGPLLADDAGNLYATGGSGGASSLGTLVELPSGQSTLTLLGTFNATNGSGPVGSLVMDSSGDIFGVTDAGGSDSSGVLYEWAKSSGSIQVLQNFDLSTGDEPQGGLVIDGSGDIFGTTQAGGADNDGTIFELPKGSSTVTVLASFNDTNGKNSAATLLLDANGDLYGTTETGGVNGDGNIFALPAGSGAIVNLASFNGANGNQPFGGLIADPQGNLYGTTTGGGVNGKGIVYEYVNGSGIQDLADFNGSNGQLPFGQLLMDGAGNLFGTADEGGGGDGEVFALVKGSNTIIEAQSFGGGANGASPEFGLIYDSSGNLDGDTASGGANGGGTFFSLPPFNATASRLAFIQQPASTTSGATLFPSIWVAVEEPNGEVIQSDNSSTVTLSMGSGGTLLGTVTATVHSGVAIFNSVTPEPSGAGPYTLTATDGSLTPATSSFFQVAASGSVDSASMNEITGWAYDPSDPTSSINIEVDISGGPTQTFLANENRSDLTPVIGSADHGFTYVTPFLSVGSHTVTIYAISKRGGKLLLGIKTLVSQNSLFDEHYYLEMNPDVAAAVSKGEFATGYDHYIQYGQFENRSPSPYWDEAWYLQENPDVAAAVKAKTVSSGFMHYYLYGQYEDRPGVLYFNTSYYLANNADVAAAVKSGALTSAYEHYVLFGQYEGRSPMLYFSSSVYDADNSDILPDVTGETFTSDFEHFIEYGQYEGRVASLFYNEQTYLADNADVAGAVKAGVFPDGFQHWLEYGQYENRKA